MLTAKELIKILETIPADTRIYLFDRHQYLENGFQLMDDCYVPLDEVVMTKGIGAVLNSTWTGLEFGEEDD